MYGTKKFRRMENSYLISTQITNHRTLPYDNVGCQHCQKISLGFQICEGLITQFDQSGSYTKLLCRS